MFISMQKCTIACATTPFQGVIHIGAHHGEEAEDYANNGVKKVAWFEANPKMMDDLKSKSSMFSSAMEQKYFNACLSDEEGKVTFNVANNGHSSSILELGTHAKLYPHIVYTEKLELDTSRFDEFYKSSELEFDDYDFINLDVQGAELKVLKGFGSMLARDNIKAIYSEINMEKVYEECCLVEELDQYLGQFGFERIATVMEGTAPKSWGDALWLRTGRPVSK